MKKTPLYDSHLKAGGKIVGFHGWLLPIQYKGIIDEHEHVRTSAGLFDVSHMGELDVKGSFAGEYIQSMVTNDISKLADGQVTYSPMCYPDGGTVDDILVYRFDKNHFLLVVNASNVQKDYEWLKSSLKSDVKITDMSEDYAQLALQGPKAQTILQKLVAENLDGIALFCFRNDMDINGVKAIVSRTGYTGEDGFEIYAPAAQAVTLWDMLLEAGREEDLVPVGLGARDTLRFEVALPLYGQELSETISPLEAGLQRFVKMNKPDFCGKDALVRQAEEGLKRKLVGFEMLDRGVPRSHFEVLADGKPAGIVTSGGFSPSLKKNIGMVLLEVDKAIIGGEIEVIVRDKALKAGIVKLPFYKKNYKK